MHKTYEVLKLQDWSGDDDVLPVLYYSDLTLEEARCKVFEEVMAFYENMGDPFEYKMVLDFSSNNVIVNISKYSVQGEEFIDARSFVIREQQY